MNQSRPWCRRAPLWCILSLSALLPACDGAHRSQAPWIRSPDDGASNVVQRPVYGPPEGRNFFVSGYAGASYGPVNLTRPTALRADCVAVPSQPDVRVDQGTWAPE
jgi:hypothetical protein